MTIPNLKATDLKARVNRMIERELQRCERAMGPAAWTRHREWVTEHVVCGARAWLNEQARNGAL
ncbi:hypothetical protein WM40_17300 [Robbsia andropogonis]|uniref:Uncharacterized protein n=1 Tax=Robbsia andropogonis TaxID=28092 RepID=A0A0F5JX45_9BURK|nr:hypothetical protein [Robbsia andropogonis]KKB62398.1 hypothetical protein WM40_17300 [Robbsia andropogonis]